jgi:hypothetical protein
MKIDIGPDGDVVATKRVNQSGSVTGLKAHAGKEVLIVSAPSRARYQMTLRDRVHQARKQAVASAVQVAGEAKKLRATWQAERGERSDRVRQRAPPAALKALDKAQESMDRAQAWMHTKRVELEQRAEDARTRAKQARGRIESRAETTKDDLENRVRSFKDNLEHGTERRRQQMEQRLSALRDDVDARWRQTRKQLGDQAIKVKVQVRQQLGSLRKDESRTNGHKQASRPAGRPPKVSQAPRAA